ncbi:hypothetical protein LV83_01323 [Algoriphagus yeomjeoni]|uniref:Uncharacterized protein n=1 Tax=Algoriphagus yeomjeoni TaxID=291403 RepID=A0A327PII6_9BACT|nr:hypothetical protein LV83_01323 [Algoriphagus yeomjeoni]
MSRCLKSIRVINHSIAKCYWNLVCETAYRTIEVDDPLKWAILTGFTLD